MEAFIKRWQFTRSETLEILASLTDEQLQFKPTGKAWQPLFHQFGCMGRTQLIYAEAAKSGIMDFSLFASSTLPSKDTNQTQDAIKAFLVQANEAWLEALQANTAGIVWPDETKMPQIHLMSLAEHERLHQGQLISYFTIAGYDLPLGFKRNWAL